MPDLLSNYEPWFDESIDASDPALTNTRNLDTYDDLCPGPQAQGPISVEHTNLEYEPESAIDSFSSLAHDLVSLNPAMSSSSLEGNFGFNSNPNHGSQNPLSPVVNQTHMTGRFPLANNVNPLPIPGDLTGLDLFVPSWSSNLPSASFTDMSSTVPSLGSVLTHPTSPNLLTQPDSQHPPRLPLPALGMSEFRCSVCAWTFALRGQLRYWSLITTPGIYSC